MQVVDQLGPDEVAVSFDEPEPPRTVTPTIDSVALEDLVGRGREERSTDLTGVAAGE